ncbi:hypothetical protein D6C76_07664 [Aureobasidium pullulans]|nr:hypothetical protein D6C76_07664 [Aureobasidium pullulans]
MPPKKRTSDASAPTPQAKTRKSNSGATLPDAASKTTTIPETSTTADAATTATLEAFERRLNEKLSAFHNTSAQHASKLEQIHDDELSDVKLRDDPHTFIVMCVPLFEYEERYKKEHKTNFRHPSQDDMPKEEWYRLCDAQDERKANVRREWADTHNSRQCACFNPSNEKNRWFMTRKGKYRMVEAETREIPHRDAEAFGLSVYTDNRGYSYQEIIENDLLEFSKINNKRDGKTEELWSIMEGLTLWINKDNADDIAFTWANLEDGARWNKTTITMGYAFLAVLNRIDREGEFKADSKYKNLSLMLALWYKFAWNYDANITDEFDEDTDYGEEKEGDDHLTKYQHVFNLTWPRYLLAMAQQYDVPIAGVTEIEESVKKDLESIKGLKLPKKRVDRFKFKDMLANFKFDYGSVMGENARIESSYDGKDPLSAEDIDALKKGGRIGFGYS